jgi:uncharacterized protein (TIGR02145 family)
MKLPIIKPLFFSALIIVVASISSCKTETTPLIIRTVTDIDGNSYDIQQEGTQAWLMQNLKTTHYRDGSPIIEIEDSATWANIYSTGATTPAWCYYNGNDSNNLGLGKLYNWYSVTDPRELCPTGWHVPSDTEWHTLILSLDSNATWNANGEESLIAGGEMKAPALWIISNYGQYPISDFNAFPAGSRLTSGVFTGVDSLAVFWSSTKTQSAAWCRSLYYNNSNCTRSNNPYQVGHSVRCVKD